MQHEECAVLIIGAGPAGALAATLLARRGHKVVVLERDTFPRFSIGESLLPQSMAFLEEAGLLQAVVEEGFQYKNGASFVWRNKRTMFDFRDKFTPGWGTTFQVQRARFDQILADGAQKAGADVRFGWEVREVHPDSTAPRLVAASKEGTEVEFTARHVLDASGFGRVLQRLLQLETPSGFPVRAALFTHIEDGVPPKALDRTKITVAIHPDKPDVWYWLIPFSNGRASIGVVGPKEEIVPQPGDLKDRLRALVDAEPELHSLLSDANWDTLVRHLVNYSCNVKSLVGPGYTLLGNAGEFLDPVFSSGVTVAMRSASMAAACLHRQLGGETVDWQESFEQPLRSGIACFRAFVESWYTGALPKIFFYPTPPPEVRRMIASILAGYAWDAKNPYAAEPQRRLRVLEKLCSG